MIKPVIGIIGGAGPDATVDVQKKLFKAMKLKIGAISDQDHYPVLVDVNTQIPDRNLSLLSGKTNILPYYIDSAKKLENMGANLIGIACNTAHYFFSEVQNKVAARLVNMLEETADSINNEKITQIGLLGTEATIKMKLYDNYFFRRGIKIFKPSNIIQKKISCVILCIKAGIWDSDFSFTSHRHLQKIQNNLQDKDVLSIKDDLCTSIKILLHEICDYFHKNGVQHIVLGCTELPLVFNDGYFRPDNLLTIDPNQILANRLIDYAIETERKYL